MWVSVTVTHLAHDQKTGVRILYPLKILLCPGDEIGKHNKLKTCRLTALKVRVLFRIYMYIYIIIYILN
jgi:hypothetical protein